MLDLSTRDIKFLAGVGPSRAKTLNQELQIFSLKDLIYYFPYKYVDRSKVYTISELSGTMPYVQLKGRILSFNTVGEGRKKRLVARFYDGTGYIDLVWFRGIKYVTTSLKLNYDYLIFGKPTAFNGQVNIAHPDMEEGDEVQLSNLGLKPYYNTSEKMKRVSMNSQSVERIMKTAVDLLHYPIPETLPEYILTKYKLMPLHEALKNIHFPSDPTTLRNAQYRLKFEELLYIQLNILSFSKERQYKYKGYVFSKVGDYFNGFFHNDLPFELTGAQKRVLKEIRKDLGSGVQMNRLLQGDVGSGKTLVALMSMLIALDNGYQTCMMAPTEILASQHFETIKEFLKTTSIEVELLTGSTRKKERERILEGLRSGKVQIIIGTHALLEDTVVFKSLGFAVIDEQHRFGVAQRARLWEKNENVPHILVMTATPIPRTLAMTLYGDLEVSVIDELPPGRKPIQTLHLFDNRRKSLNKMIREQLDLGRQVYYVFPLIEESEKIDLKNLEQGYEWIKEDFPEYEIVKVHGKMKPADKDEQMNLFASGKAHIMVATTVIEVGVNVPNASVMVIENAERFGLSQLHQLRGRVGRGAEQSFCLLVTGYKLSEVTRKRIAIMVETNDGFEIAEADLKLRGPGDLEGTQQSGVAFDLKIADLAKDGQILQVARTVALDVLEEDPHQNLEQNKILWSELKSQKKSRNDWSAIS